MTALGVDRMRSAFLLPVKQFAPGRTLARICATVVCVAVALGLFTISWERLGNIAAGPYNVKLPSLLFTIAAVCSVPMWRARFAELAASRVLRAILLLVPVVLAVLVLAVAVSSSPARGVGQLVAVLTGAVFPAIATLVIVRDRRSLRWTLRWFVAGSLVASIFGLYQLLAFYVGLPQMLGGTDAGVDGVTGRIQGFNYEPAYFAVFIVFALAASASLALVSGRVLAWAPAVWFALVLVLMNVRALAFLLPVLAVLLALRWKANRRLLLRLAVAGTIVLLANAVIPAAVTALADPGQAPVSSTPAAAGTAPLAGESEAPRHEREADHPRAGEEVEAPVRVANPPRALLDPNEESSNGPRLDLYRAVAKVVSAHPVLGVGPGNLGSALQETGYVPPNQSGSIVANNIWLQALADGGVVLLLVELALLVTVALLLLDRGITPVQPLLAAWLAVVLVDGMLTSYFFDLKVWVVLAVIVAAAAFLRKEGPLTPGRTRAAR